MSTPLSSSRGCSLLAMAERLISGTSVSSFRLGFEAVVKDLLNLRAKVGPVDLQINPFVLVVGGNLVSIITIAVTVPARIATAERIPIPVVF